VWHQAGATAPEPDPVSGAAVLVAAVSAVIQGITLQLAAFRVWLKLGQGSCLHFAASLLVQ